jgi:hypothetical protein
MKSKGRFFVSQISMSFLGCKTEPFCQHEGSFWIVLLMAIPGIVSQVYPAFPGMSSFIRLRRRPRPLAVDECVNLCRIHHEPRFGCSGGFRCWRITRRSLGIGGYFNGGTTGFARGAPCFDLHLQHGQLGND